MSIDAYDAARRLTGITGSITGTVTADYNGNITQIVEQQGLRQVTHSFVYDWENRLTEAAWADGTIDYYYDGLSRLVQSARGGNTFQHVWETNGQNVGTVKLASPNVYGTDWVWTRRSRPVEGPSPASNTATVVNSIHDEKAPQSRNADILPACSLEGCVTNNSRAAPLRARS